MNRSSTQRGRSVNTLSVGERAGRQVTHSIQANLIETALRRRPSSRWFQIAVQDKVNAPVVELHLRPPFELPPEVRNTVHVYVTLFPTCKASIRPDANPRAGKRGR